MIVTNFYPGHFHWEPTRLSFASAGHELVSIADREGCRPDFDGPADGQFIFNYPISERIANQVIDRSRRGERLIVMMDDPLAFFDSNINPLILPVLQSADTVFTSSDNMLPIYAQLGIRAKLLVGLANPLFDVAEPVSEVEMEYDWGFFGRLVPQRFRFFWQLRQLLPDLRGYIVTEGFGHEAVRDRVRRTRCNLAYGNFSDITGFEARGTTLRSWEFPYCGGFLLQDERPLLVRHFTEGESMVTFRTVEQCAALVRHYRDRSNERQRIAANARHIIDGNRMLDFLPALFEAPS